MEAVKMKKTPDKGVKRKSKTTEEMGDEHHSLTLVRLQDPGGITRACRDDIGRRQIPSVMELIDLLLGITVEDLHIPLVLGAFEASTAAFLLPFGGFSWIPSPAMAKEN